MRVKRAPACSFMGERAKLILFNSITVAGAGVVYAAIGFVPSSAPLVVVMGFALINFLSGAASGECAARYSRLSVH